MRGVVQSVKGTLVLATIYVIFVGEVTVWNYLIGIVVALIARKIVFTFIKKEAYNPYVNIKGIELLKYAGYLLYEILACGLKVFIWIIKEKVVTKTFIYKSELEEEILLNMLASSITLTPGTVSVNRKDNEILVMQLKPQKEKHTSESIQKMEQKIKKLM